MDIESGFYYHIFNRGNNSQKIFFIEDNYRFFLKKMKKHISPFASIVSWCLMPNHFHWIVFVRRERILLPSSDLITLCEGVTKSRTINQSIGIMLRSYTRTIQKQEKTTGSLFQKHTKAKALIEEVEIVPAYWQTEFGTEINTLDGKSYLETCVEYIHQNPVYSGLVKYAEDWEYSSYRDYLGVRNGKLIDYELIKSEGLLPAVADSDTLTQSEGITNWAIVGFGSNIDAEINITQALKLLERYVDIIQSSSWIKTKPIGIKEQADFTNGAIKVQTKLGKAELNEMLKSVEDEMGRDRTAPKFGPRCIDLDIVVWNGKVVDEDYHTRDFLQQSVEELGGV